MKEEWKEIPDFPNYMISNLGRVWNKKRKRFMTIYTRKGYSLVKLSKSNTSKEMKVHRLVAIAFIPNPYNLPCVNHIDEKPSNNCVNNLEWCNHQYNNTYGTRCIRQSEKIKIPIKQCDMQGNIIREFSSVNDAAKELGIPACNISNCLHGRQKSAPKNLYTWKF